MKKHWQEKNMKLHYSRLQLHISYIISYSFCSGTPTIRQRIIQYLGLITHIYLILFSLFCCAVYIMMRSTFVIALLLI